MSERSDVANEDSGFFEEEVTPDNRRNPSKKLTFTRVIAIALVLILNIFAIVGTIGGIEISQKTESGAKILVAVAVNGTNSTYG